MTKPYDVAVQVGRFNIYHNGHRNNTETALKLADRVLILVGSAQEQGTERNPFDVGTRIDIIREIYGDSVTVSPLPDLTHERDISPDWGRYLMKQIKYYIRKPPDILIYGDEDANGWFAPEDITSTIRIVMPKTRIPFSASIGRELLVRGNFEEWAQWHDSKTHKHFERLRSQILQCDYYKDMFRKINEGKK